MKLSELNKQIDKDKFSDDFWNEFSKLVPEHLRPKLSIHHIRFMIDAFFKTLEKQNNETQRTNHALD